MINDIYKLLENYTANDLLKLYDFYNNINLIVETDRDELLVFLSSPKMIFKLSHHINDSNDFATFYLILILKLISLKNSKWNENSQYLNLIEYAITVLRTDIKALETILNSVQGNLEYVANLLLICYKKTAYNQFIKNQLSELMLKIEQSHKGSSLKDIHYFMLETDEGSWFVYDEFKENLLQSTNKLDFFYGFKSKVFDKNNNFRNQYFSKAVSFYLGHVKEISLYNDNNDYFETCYTILEQIKKENLELPKDLLTEIVSCCENMLPLVSLNTNQKIMLETICKVKTDQNICTLPSIPDFVDLCTEIESVSTNETLRKLISNTNLDLTNIDFYRYEEWLDFCIPKAIGTATTWQMHAFIKKVFCANNLKGIFFAKYVGILSDVLYNNDANSAEIFIQFIIYFINAKKDIDEENYIQIKSNIINILLRFTESNLDEIDKLLNIGLTSLRNKELIINEWLQIQKRLHLSISSKKDFSIKHLKNNRIA